MTKTLLGAADDHQCSTLCRDWVVGSEVVAWHDSTFADGGAAFVTVQSFDGTERFDAGSPLTHRMLEAMGIDWR